MTRARVLVVLAVAAVLGSPVAAQKDVAAPDVLRSATDYLSAYAPRVSGVTLQEEYTLLDVSGGRLNATRRISSDVVLLNLTGRVIAMRDPYAIDDNPLRERTPRITALLAKPTLSGWEQAQDYAREFLRYFMDDLVVRLNEPTLALQFIAPAAQATVTYKIDGRKKIAGVETVGLRFQETKTKEADYIVKTAGKAAGSGRAWIDPATGRIHRTELTMQSNEETARITVEYARDASLDVWLPSSVVSTFDTTERVGTGMSNMGAGSPGIARRSFEGRANYSKARLTPIELTFQK